MYLTIILYLFIPLHVLCFNSEFLLFENFELTRKSFIEEQSVFRHMADTRKKLNDTVNHLSDNSDTVTNEFQSTIKMGQNSSNKHRIIKQAFIQGLIQNKSTKSMRTRIWEDFYAQYRIVKKKYNFTYSYEKVYKGSEKLEIVKSALRGVLMLRETFEQNITDFSKGHLCLKNIMYNSSRRIDSLKLEDIAAMSKIAFNQFNYYDSAIEYLKAAINIFYNEIGKRSDYVYRTLDELLSFMKKNYPSFHNEMLSKMDISVGIDWKLYPVMVDEGI